MLNTTPRTWVTSEVVTAAFMNTEIRDAFTGIQAAYTSFTPAWTASTTNPVLGNGTLTGKYTRTGKDVEARIVLVMGSTTTFGAGSYRLSMPVAPHAENYTATFAAIGQTSMFDTSAAARIFRLACCIDATNIDLRDAANTGTNPTSPWTWAVGDALISTFAYEAA